MTTDEITQMILTTVTPFGLLSEEAQQAMKGWPHSFEMYSGAMAGKSCWVVIHTPTFSPHITYRAALPEATIHTLTIRNNGIPEGIYTHALGHRITVVPM